MEVLYFAVNIAVKHAWSLDNNFRKLDFNLMSCRFNGTYLTNDLREYTSRKLHKTEQSSQDSVQATTTSAPTNKQTSSGAISSLLHHTASIIHHPATERGAMTVKTFNFLQYTLIVLRGGKHFGPRPLSAPRPSGNLSSSRQHFAMDH